MKSLQQLWDEHDGRLIDKWAHYLPIYERHFARWRCFDRGLFPIVLEIGVSHGGSLQLWKKYFGTCIIHGVDIDPRCKDYEEPGISIHTMSQTDPAIGKIGIGQFDIVIDDGSHRLEDQKASLDILWPRLRQGGVYLVEDCHHNTFPELAAPGEHSEHFYPWVAVYEKLKPWKPERIVTGHPSRPLNEDEQKAYGLTACGDRIA